VTRREEMAGVILVMEMVYKILMKPGCMMRSKTTTYGAELGPGVDIFT
jgi:hypothetical protein